MFNNNANPNAGSNAATPFNPAFAHAGSPSAIAWITPCQKYIATNATNEYNANVAQLQK